LNTHKIIFDSIAWTDAGTGVRFKAFVHGSQRLRLVEFSEGFVEPDWCTRGHASIVLDGSFSIDFHGSIERYEKDDVVFIPSGEAERHKAMLGNGEKVTLLLFELLEG
jgi:quercetin dioxygenase-like cupin family protein